MRTCKVEGCDGKYHIRGYCKKHYAQWYRNGEVKERTLLDKNEIIKYDNYAEIIIYSKDGSEKCRAKINLHHIETVSKYKWNTTSNGYVSTGHGGNRIWLHRLIINAPDDKLVDHIDRDKLNNLEDNLRLCTQTENNRNRGVQSRSKLGVVGVIYDCRMKKPFIPHIRVNGKTKKLGNCSTLEEAIEVRAKAELEYYGEFAPSKGGTLNG